VGQGLAWRPDWPHYNTDRPSLLPALAAACTREWLALRMSPDLASSVVMALRLDVQDYRHDDNLKKLADQARAADGASREALFRASYTFHQAIHPTGDAWRLFETTRLGDVLLIAERDEQWVRAGLGDTSRPTAERATMLQAVLSGMFEGEEKWRHDVERLRADVADQPELVALLDARLQPARISPEHAELKAKLEEKQRRNEEERASASHDSPHL